MRVKLLAAVSLLAVWHEGPEDEFDFDELRRQLGLPTPTPIVLDENAMGMLPPTRLERVDVAKLNDKDLEKGLHRAAIFAIRNALRRFAEEIVHRDSLAGQGLQQASLRVARGPQGVFPKRWSTSRKAARRASPRARCAPRGTCSKCPSASAFATAKP